MERSLRFDDPLQEHIPQLPNHRGYYSGNDGTPVLYASTDSPDPHSFLSFAKVLEFFACDFLADVPSGNIDNLVRHRDLLFPVCPAHSSG